MAGAAEDRFGIRIPDESLGRFQTVGDAVDYIRRARRVVDWHRDELIVHQS